MSRNSLEKKIEQAINRKKTATVMRKDLISLGGYDQIGRSLQNLIIKKKIMRLGYGVYVKTRVSPLNGNVIPAAPPEVVGKEIAKKLRMKTYESPLKVAYNEGRSEQIPTGLNFYVNGRISRKLVYQGRRLNFATYR